MSIGAVILAAGFARRFGSDKRLALLEGETIAEHTTRIYRDVFDHIRVVMRPDDQQLRQLLVPLDCEIIDAPDAHLGMGHSLAAGIAGVDWAWAFVALLDMPFIEPGTLQKLKQKALDTGRGIVRPRLTSMPDAPAHPIGFSRDYFPEIAASRGDHGARAVLQAHAAEVVVVDVEDSGVVRDVDRPGDLARR